MEPKPFAISRRANTRAHTHTRARTHSRRRQRTQTQCAIAWRYNARQKEIRSGALRHLTADFRTTHAAMPLHARVVERAFVLAREKGATRFRARRARKGGLKGALYKHGREGASVLCPSLMNAPANGAGTAHFAISF